MQVESNLRTYLLRECQSEREGSTATIVCYSVNKCLLVAFVVTTHAATSRRSPAVKELLSSCHDLQPGEREFALTDAPESVQVWKVHLSFPS